MSKSFITVFVVALLAFEVLATAAAAEIKGKLNANQLLRQLQQYELRQLQQQQQHQAPDKEAQNWSDWPTYEPTYEPATDSTPYWPPYSTERPEPTDWTTYWPTASTERPTEWTTYMSTERPTESPTDSPTEWSTYWPTGSTERPTEWPTDRPTEWPTERPTESTTYWPTTTYWPETSTGRPSCPSDWLDTPYGCFFFDLGTCMYGCSWFEAFQICRSMGGHLVELSTQDKWHYVSSQLDLLTSMTHTENFRWWTGAHYNRNSGYFDWFSSGQHGYFFDWDWFEPSAYADSAVFVAAGSDSNSFRWFAAHDGDRHGHPICEK